MPVQPVPDGYHTVTPYLLVRGVAPLLEFLKTAFEAEVKECVDAPGGQIMHAQVQVGDSRIMMGECPPDGEFQPMPAFLYLYVEDADAWYRRALEAGGTSAQEPRDEFYGDRTAGVKDPVGNLWWIATHVEDVPSEEIARRAAARQGG